MFNGVQESFIQFTREFDLWNYPNGAERAHLENMFCTCLRQTIWGVGGLLQ